MRRLVDLDRRERRRREEECDVVEEPEKNAGAAVSF
jgi:hypothetical protein